MKYLINGLVRIVTAIDWPMMLILMVLASAGMLVMHSAVGGTDWRFAEQLRNFAVALVALWVVALIPQPVYMKFALPCYVLGLGLLVAVMLFGDTSKGATRWLNIGIGRIQPSEMMKIAMPLMLAWYFQVRDGSMRFFDFLAAMLLLIVPFALIVKQPDLGTAILVLSAGAFVIYFAGLSFKLLIPLAIGGVIAVTAVVSYQDVLCKSDFDWVVLRDYQKHRICTLLDPTTDPLGKGFHTIQSTIAVGSGGLFGKGYMKGTQTHLDFIPERTTDFIFAVFAEEFGMYGGVTLLIIYGLLIARGLTIALRAQTQFGRLLAGALTMVLFIYVFVNVGMVTGILPVVGVPLPLMSYGGTALLTIGVACGMLMSINRYRPTPQ